MTIIVDGWELLEFDPVTQKSVWGIEDGDQIIIREDQPVDALLKQNREAFNSAPDHWQGDWHRVASIPLNVLYNSGMDDAIGQKDDRWTARWLNDSDNRAWRTRGGTV